MLRNKISCLPIALACLSFVFSSFSVVAEEAFFQHGENRLEAVHLLPTGPAELKGIVVFVHGDGPLNYEAEGYYPLIWNFLRNQGFAIFSWSKPGVGASSGQWLEQSMLDRQSEVQAAIDFIRANYHYTGEEIGLLGFSQAGWVVPAVANNNPDVGFVVGIGFAMNWINQSWYLSKTRLVSQGKTPAEIDLAYEEHLEEIDRLKQRPGYQQYRAQNKNGSNLMSEQRYGFAERNFEADALNDYKNLQQPLLVLLGDQDLNVDINETKEKLLTLFRHRNNLQVSIIPNASHSLLKAKGFNQQSPGIFFWLKLMWVGETALAPEFLPILGEWINRLDTTSSITY
ncbi:MAG: alpha-beta hydrolase superfamily lysophospholipase [Candidatus Azotimanducaceae bacterium]|jgi:alpha-beta hydrolase superfamily lysophospholipase